MAKNTALAAYKAGERAAKDKPKHRKNGFTIPLAVAAGFGPLVGMGLQGYREAGYSGASNKLVYGLSGYDMANRNWSTQGLAQGLLPIMIGLVVHKVVGNRLGVNRMLSRARIPFVRL